MSQELTISREPVGIIGQVERDIAELKTPVRFLMAIQVAILALLVAPYLT